MGEVVAEVCGSICGAFALACTASISAWCNTVPLGLTLCRCCDTMCACGCCWKGGQGPLPEEDYPGGANHPDTAAAAQRIADAAKQAQQHQQQGDEGDGAAGTGAKVPAPPPYDAKVLQGNDKLTTTTQPSAQPGMSVPNSES
ncbi:unnamed protein product [Tilletia controversa]|nr:unnamed protein product [Tilletia controversa]